MTTVAAPRAVARHSALTELVFLGTLFTITFAKVHWTVAGDVSLADLFTMLFLLAFAAERLAAGDGGLPRTAATVGGFMLAFLVVYLAGFFNLDTIQAVEQFGKGLTKFVLHFLFIVAGVAYLVRRSEAFYWKALAAFVLGIAANAAYGVVQLAAARAGVNLDQALLAPLTGGASAINVYGAVGGEQVLRPNALTLDPNHLGIILIVPLLTLAPIYLRLERAHPLRVPLAVLLGFLLVVELSTLSRSGLLGLVVGALVLAIPYRRLLWSRALLAPLALVALLVGWLVSRRLEFFETVLRSRLSTGNRSLGVHFDVYSFVPDVLQTHPLFGFGLNNFSVYYEFVTGRTNFGPHSFYVATLVETGIVGAVSFGVFLWWIFTRLRAARVVGRARPDAPVLPLAWGLTAALAGTMAANLFYLTMIFYSFFAFVILALAAAPVFSRRVPPAGGAAPFGARA